MSDSVKILLILLAVLALAVLYALLNWPRQERVGGETSATGVVAGVPELETRTPEAVPSESEEQPEPATGVVHNIFAPLFAPPPRPVASIDTESPAVEPVVVPAVPLPPPPPPRPVPEFLGLLRYEGGQRAFLSVSGDVYVVAPGGRFGPENHFRLLGITQQKLTVQHDDDQDSFEISIAEQPISVLSSSGPSYVFPSPEAPLAPLESEEPKEVAPPDSGKSNEEVPLDETIDE